MGQRMVTDARMRQPFGIVGNTISINPDAIEAYLRKVKRWKEELLALVHMSVGAPVRTTELISMQQENGANARSHRGIFIDHGIVAFVTSYHKGFSASKEQKCVHRFVPHKVGGVSSVLFMVGRPVRSVVAAQPWADGVPPMDVGTGGGRKKGEGVRTSGMQRMSPRTPASPSAM